MVQHTILFFLFLHLFGQVATAQTGGRFAREESIQQFFRLDIQRSRPLILAHRGGPEMDETENSLETFRRTHRQVPDAILEMDVRMTADSVLVLLHDDELERTTTGTGSLKAKRWAELRRLYLRRLDGQATRQRIPLFADVLRWNANRAVLALDAKPGIDLDRMMNLVEKQGALHSVFVICYTVRDAIRLRERYPTLWLALGFTQAADAERIRKEGMPLSKLIALCPRELPAASFFEALHRLGIPCSVGTYGTGNSDEKPMAEAAELYRRYVRQGADILTTDRPVAVQALFQP